MRDRHRHHQRAELKQKYVPFGCRVPACRVFATVNSNDTTLPQEGRRSRKSPLRFFFFHAGHMDTAACTSTLLTSPQAARRSQNCRTGVYQINTGLPNIHRSCEDASSGSSRAARKIARGQPCLGRLHLLLLLVERGEASGNGGVPGACRSTEARELLLERQRRRGLCAGVAAARAAARVGAGVGVGVSREVVTNVWEGGRARAPARWHARRRSPR